MERLELADLIGIAILAPERLPKERAAALAVAAQVPQRADAELEMIARARALAEAIDAGRVRASTSGGA